MNKNTKSWEFKVYVLTWNVSTKFPDQLSMNRILGLEIADNDLHMPDLYVIGLQEVNSQPQNVVIGLFKDDPWTSKFREILSKKDYIAIKTEQMQGLLLTLFVKRKHLLHLRHIEAEYTRTGMGGLWGNKGAISIRLDLYGCGVTFINAHLAAHDEHLDERIEDFNQILENHHYHVSNYREIFDHEYVFWFGDLNFRLTGENITPQEIRSLVLRDRLDDLFERDQLSLVRKEKRGFHQFEERTPCFPPTFKFEIGTNDYDMKRRPAWTDRILYKIRSDTFKNIELDIEQLSYKSHPEYIISDHKPVTSEFKIMVLEDPLNNILVEFSNIPVWHIGEENVIEYSIPYGFEESSSDWIGVFPSNYSSLDDYIAYEYTTRSRDQGKSPKPIHRNQMKNVQNEQSIKKSIRLEFSESIDLKEDEYFILLYFENTGIRGVFNVAGFSNIFRAEKRPPSPRFEEVD